MPALVLGDDLQTGPNGESHQGHEGILVAYAIHVVGAGLRNQLARDSVFAKEHLEDRRIDLFGWLDFLGRPSPRAPGVLGDVISNKPTTESSERDFMNRRLLATFECN